MKSSRQAVLRVYFELLEQLLPDWQTAAMLRFGDLSCESRLGNSAKIAEIAAPFHKALKLPRNCRITGISHNLYFDRGQIAFRIECPDFRETPMGATFPEVQAVYQTSLQMTIRNPSCSDSPAGFVEGSAELDGIKSYFLRWDGLAVETKRVYDCNGVEVGIPFPDEVADELDKYFERKSLTAPPVEMDYSVTPNEVRALRDQQPCVLGGNFVRSDIDPITMDTVTPKPWLRPEGGIEVPPEIAAVKCWKCPTVTERRLPDGTAECYGCAEKPLF